MSKKYPMTQAGKKKLEHELTYLRDIRRKELAEDINEIKTLENMINNATLISEKQPTSTISLGSTVTFIETPGGEPETYSIVGTTDADPSQNKISSESPIATSLLGNKENDKVTIQTPGGTIQVKIVHVK